MYSFKKYHLNNSFKKFFKCLFNFHNKLFINSVYFKCYLGNNFALKESILCSLDNILNKSK